MPIGLAVGLAMMWVAAQVPNTAPQDEVLARAEQATWGVAMVGFTAAGRVADVRLLGSGFFVSREHFVTAEHVLNVKAVGRVRGPRDQIRIFKTGAAVTPGDFKGPFKIIYENADLDAAILQGAFPAPAWFTISTSDLREGDEIGLFGYPMANFDSRLRVNAGAIGRRGVVLGFGRQGQVRRLITTLSTALGNSGGPEFLITSGHAVAIHKGQLIDAAGKDVAGHSISTPLSSMRAELERFGIDVR
jgi:hypothetical protein